MARIAKEKEQGVGAFCLQDKFERVMISTGQLSDGVEQDTVCSVYPDSLVLVTSWKPGQSRRAGAVPTARSGKWVSTKRSVPLAEIQGMRNDRSV